ncbi:hypothetical protein GQ42DRAFT_160798 [Ramicandelaber brevisporus]|nr:hypothetical protein GQ42DRAFT_160798 [Ramicandelaber brevisporus]
MSSKQELSLVKCAVKLPINSLASTAAGDVLLCGGGGAGRSGVKNRLRVARIDAATGQLSTVAETVLSSNEDAPWNLAPHPDKDTRVVAVGINGSADDIASGDANNCRIFDYSSIASATEQKAEEEQAKSKADAFSLVKKKTTLTSKRATDYQSVCRFSTNGKHLLIGGTDGTAVLLAYPSLENGPELVSGRRSKTGKVLDASFDAESKLLALASAAAIDVHSVSDGAVSHSIAADAAGAGEPCDFRAIGFSPAALAKSPELVSTLYVVMNAKSKKRAYLAAFDSATWKLAKRATAVSKHPVLTFAISFDGTLLALATSAAEVMIVCARTLRVLARFPDAHEVAITGLAFSPDGKFLVTGSIDENCNVIALPNSLDAYPGNRGLASPGTLILILLAIIMVILAVYYRDLAL